MSKPSVFAQIIRGELPAGFVWRNELAVAGQEHASTIMTAADFRRLALSLPGAEERSHMGHPDFRVGGKVFASLGYPDAGFAAIMLSPQDQDLLIRDYPKAFQPAAGAWGRSGSTSVKLRVAPRRAVTFALESAWRRRAPKKLLAST